MQEVFSKQFPSGVSKVEFHKSKTNLSLGFDNGDVRFFKIYIHESSDISRNLVDEVCHIRPHKNPVLSVAMDIVQGYIFSIAKEGQLVISEYNYQTSIKTISVSKLDLTAMLYDEENHLIIISDSFGSLYFYNVSNPINPIKLQAIHSQFKAITLLKIDKTSNKLIIGTKTGETHLFDFEITSEGLHMKQFNSIYTNKQFKVINTYFSYDYQLIGYSNGSIYVYSEKNDYPECKIHIII